MPEKGKVYLRVIFTPSVIKDAVEVLRNTIPNADLTYLTFHIDIENESWDHSTEEEFFADYNKGFVEARFWNHYRNPENYTYEGDISISVDSSSNTRITVAMGNRADVEKVFNVFEENVDNCRIPKQPNEISTVQTDWITENISKIETHCPIAASKVRLALLKLDSEEAEEWQNATMLIRDAWIELSQWLCQVKGIDTSEIESDKVIDRLKKLGIHNNDEKLFNLAKASFSLYSKHHDRDIDNYIAMACVISSIASMYTVIRETFNTK